MIESTIHVLELAEVIAMALISEGDDLNIPEILKNFGAIASDLNFPICEHNENSFFSLF
jgi:hypothetical protein